MQITGGCHCGNIRYRANVDEARVGICHCTDCQIMSGGAFRTVAMVPEAEFELLQGTPKIYVKLADSGNQREQVFCADCGTHLYATSVGGEPRTFNIRSSTADQRESLIPRAQFWHDSAVSYLHDFDDMTTWPKSPR